MASVEDRGKLPRSGAMGPLTPLTESALDSFEREWQSGHEPRIEDFLAAVPEAERPTLFLALLSTEVSIRRRRGEHPRPENYSTRFPEYADRLAEVDWSLSLASTVLVEQAPSRRLDHFHLLSQVGTGGFGTVWKGRDTKLGRTVAVKVPHPYRLAANGKGLFLREARAAAKLRHPNVVTIHEVRDDGDSAYIVYEFIDGISLQQWLTAKRPSPREAARLSAKVARAVHHAHDNGVVHRDLKPGNVLIDRVGEPHVTDFGIAKGAASDESATREGQIIGSLPYLSPEQASGRSHEADARTDVYGLGVILYELLAGRRPFRGEDAVLLHMILTEDPPPPRRFDRDIPKDLETIALRAMAKEPARRYATAADFADDLERYLAGLPIVARRAGAVERSVRWSRRHATAMLLVSAGAAATTAFAAPALAIPSFRRRLLGLFGEVTPVELDPVFPTDGTPADLVPDGADELEKRPVVIRTDPPGAEVWLFERNRRTGWYKAREGQRIETTPISKNEVAVDLRPGEYLAVAAKGKEFIEASRWVPYPGHPEEAEPFQYRTLFWELVGGKVYIDVAIRTAPAKARMVRFEGSDAFEFRYPAGSSEMGEPKEGCRRLAVPPFLMARDEFAWADFFAWDEDTPTDNAVWRGAYRRIGDLPADHAMVGVSFDEASCLLEFFGMRMPREAEWCFAARSATPDWPALAKGAPRRGLGAVGVPGADLVGPVPGVRGLYSGAAEWTIDWGVPSADDRRAAVKVWRGGLAQLYQQPRAVRGGSRAVTTVEPIPLVTPQTRDASLRLSVARGETQYSGLGFRGARSVRPPRNEEDFVRDLGPVTDGVA